MSLTQYLGTYLHRQPNTPGSEAGEPLIHSSAMASEAGAMSSRDLENIRERIRAPGDCGVVDAR